MSQFENKMTPNGEWKSLDKVGLSILPNFTSHISIKVFRNYEGIVTFKSIKKPTKEKQTPPIRKTKLDSIKLTDSAKTQIRKCCRMFYDHALKTSKNGICTMITLSYPEHYPNDRESKKHLDHFMKRIVRKYPNFIYLWVAEKQKRGAIHYHIITTDFIPKKFINTSWREIVAKWSLKNGFNNQKEANPHIMGVKHPDRYITKYLLKDEINRIEGNRYFISKNARKLMEPIESAIIPIFSNYPNQIMDEASLYLNIEYLVLDNSKKINEGDKYMVFGYFVKDAQNLIDFANYDYQQQLNNYYNQFKNEKGEE